MSARPKSLEAKPLEKPSLTLKRRINAPPAKIFAAWTNPEYLPQWMLGPDGYTMPVCELDLRPGGAWRFVWRGPDGRDLAMHGEYREVVRPERIVNTEHWGEPWPETLNAVEFHEDDDGTTIICTVVYPSREARDAALETGMKDGMNQSFDRLTALLG